MPGKIQVQDVDVKAERRQRLLKRSGVIAGGVLLVAIAGGASWYFTPPAMPETIDEARAVIESPRFERLSKEAKQPYYDVIREQYGSLDPEERRRLRAEDEELSEAMRDARTVMMRQMLVQMAEMTPEERDAMIGTFRRGRPGQGPDGGPGQRPERTPEEQAERDEKIRERISDRVANGDSQMNQLMREMFSEQRRQSEGR
ncbi:MAG: hypothetical protein AAF593_09200 [Planctomycetota bacterium]